MTILVTGATGFLGSRLVGRLLGGGQQLVALVRNGSSLERLTGLLERIEVCNLDEVSIERIFESRQIDTVIHCATNYGRGENDPLAVLEANLILPLKLLHQAGKQGVRRFINTDTILDKQVSKYALAKGQFREWLETYQTSLVCVNLALEHFYGAGDDPAKFVSFVVHKLLDGAERIELTAGEQKRDFIHIDDVVSAFMTVLSGTAAIRPGYYQYQAGTGVTVTVRSCVEMIKAIVGSSGTQLDFGALPYREHEAMDTKVDTESLRALGWSPGILLKDGLERMIAEERELRKL